MATDINGGGEMKGIITFEVTAGTEGFYLRAEWRSAFHSSTDYSGPFPTMTLAHAAAAELRERIIKTVEHNGGEVAR